MPKYLLFAFSCLFVFKASFPQNQKFDQSETFGELLKGGVKLLFMENGNTVFIHVDNKEDEEIKLRVYNSSHKKILDKIVRPSSIDFSLSQGFNGIFLVRDEIVMLMSTVKGDYKSNSLLYRIIINANTGAVIKQEQIGKLLPHGPGGAKAYKNGDLEWPQFRTYKDPNSDNYAVAHFDTFEADPNKRLKITHYGADHKIISESYFTTQNDQRKYLKLKGLVVVGDSDVFIYATMKGEGEDVTSVIGRLNKESPTILQQELEFMNKKKAINSRLGYNRFTNKLIFLSTSF